MNPTVILAVLLGWTLSLGGAGWYGFGLGYDRHVAEEAKDKDAADKVRKEALSAAADAIAKIDVKNVTIQGKVIERIRTETVYSDCVHSPDTWALIQQAYKP